MNKLTKQDVIDRVSEFDVFESKQQAKQFLDDFFELVLDVTSNDGELSYAPYLKFSKFTSSTTGKSKLKLTSFKATKEAFTK